MTISFSIECLKSKIVGIFYPFWRRIVLIWRRTVLFVWSEHISTFLFDEWITFLKWFLFCLFLLTQLISLYKFELLLFLFLFDFAVLESLGFGHERRRNQLVILQMLFLFFYFIGQTVVVLTIEVNIFSHWIHIQLSGYFW